MRQLGAGPEVTPGQRVSSCARWVWAWTWMHASGSPSQSTGYVQGPYGTPFEPHRNVGLACVRPEAVWGWGFDLRTGIRLAFRWGRGGHRALCCTTRARAVARTGSKPVD